MKLMPKMTVKWPSRQNENHAFKGIIRRVVGDRAIIDDGTGKTYRVVPTNILIVTNDPTRISGIRK